MMQINTLTMITILDLELPNITIFYTVLQLVHIQNYDNYVSYIKESSVQEKITYVLPEEISDNKMCCHETKLDYFDSQFEIINNLQKDNLEQMLIFTVKNNYYYAADIIVDRMQTNSNLHLILTPLLTEAFVNFSDCQIMVNILVRGGAVLTTEQIKLLVDENSIDIIKLYIGYTGCFSSVFSTMLSQSVVTSNGYMINYMLTLCPNNI